MASMRRMAKRAPAMEAPTTVPTGGRRRALEAEGMGVAVTRVTERVGVRVAKLATREKYTRRSPVDQPSAGVWRVAPPRALEHVSKRVRQGAGSQDEWVAATYDPPIFSTSSAGTL